MSNIPVLKNVTYIDGNQTYVVKGKDDVINVKSSLGPTVIVLPNIRTNDLDLYFKDIYINDFENNAAANPITIQTNGGDTINGSASVLIDFDNGSSECVISGRTQWIANLSNDSGGGGGGPDDKVKISTADTTTNFLEDKITAGSNVSLTKQNIGANEALEISSTDTNDDEKIKISSLDTTSDFLEKKLIENSDVSLTVANPAANEQFVLGLKPTTVVAGNYTNTNLTVDANGRIASASNGAGGGSTINTGNSFWVDAVFGDDATALPDDPAKPYLTITAALAATTSGDSVFVYGGNYAESITIPFGVALKSLGGSGVTTITGALATGIRVQLGTSSLFQGFMTKAPTDATNAVEFSAAGVAQVVDLKLDGSAGGLGSGLVNTGTGKIIGTEIRYNGGSLNRMIHATAGIMAVDSVHVPNIAGGSITTVASCENSRLQCVNLNIGATFVDFAIEIGAGGVLVCLDPNIFQVKNGIHITGNDALTDVLGGKIETTTTVGGVYPNVTGYTVVVDPTLDLDLAKTKIKTLAEPNFYWNNLLSPNAAGSDFIVDIVQGNTDTRSAASRQFGTDSIIGFAERGSKFISGQGGPVATFNKVVQLDTAGTFQNDITTEASSNSASGFTFYNQNTGTPKVNESIAWCSIRRDQNANELKHFGIQMLQDSAAVGSGSSYVFEILNGAVWETIGVQCVSVENSYRYANNVFLRASSKENLFFGISNTTTWATGTIDGTLGYWARVRVAAVGLMTATPVFEQLQLNFSYYQLNEQGQILTSGAAQWRKTLFGAGNMWGEGGSASDTNVGVGSGGGLTGWNNKLKKSRMNASGDFLNFQFIINGGICTAYPVTFKISYSTISSETNAVDLSLSLLPIGVVNNLIADPAGAIAPIPRATSVAYDVDPAQVQEILNLSTTAKTIQSTIFKEFDISDFYEDDLLILRLGLNSAVSDVDVWTLEIEGVAFTDGKILE